MEPINKFLIKWSLNNERYDMLIMRYFLYFIPVPSGIIYILSKEFLKDPLKRVDSPYSLYVGFIVFCVLIIFQLIHIVLFKRFVKANGDSGIYGKRDSLYFKPTASIAMGAIIFLSWYVFRGYGI